MKTIYLHVGTHKTGSTSIQRFLARADHELAQQGILYPEAGRPQTDWSDQYGHHELAWSVSGSRDSVEENVWDELRREINGAVENLVVVSTEEFGGCTSEEIRKIVSYLDSHTIRVIVYFRSPTGYLKSQYKQLVKTGKYSESFIQFVGRLIARCNYLDLVSRWKQFDKVKSVDVRLFDKVKMDPGLEQSFAETVGIDYKDVKQFAGSPTNTSPPDPLIHVARWINVAAGLGGGETWRTLTHRARSNVLDRRWPGRLLARIMEPFLQDSLVTKPVENMVREEIGEVHERFLDEI